MEINGAGGPPFIDLQQNMQTHSLYTEDANAKRKEVFAREAPAFADQLEQRYVEGVHSKADPRAESATQNTGHAGAPHFRSMDNFRKTSVTKPKATPKPGAASSYKEEYSTELSIDKRRIDVRA